MKYLLILSLLFSPIGEYKLSTSYSINYGFGKDELGLIFENEVPPIGPNSFCVDGEGNIYISDPVNSSIKIFSGRERRVIKTFYIKGIYDDLSVTSEGDIFLLKRESSEIIQIKKDGKKLSIRVRPEIVLKPSKLLLWKGKLFIKSEKSFKNISADFEGKDSKEFYYFDVEYLNRRFGFVNKFDLYGRKISKFVIERNNIASLEFLNEDKDGNIYIQTEYMISHDKVGLEVRKLSKIGEILSVIEIPENDYFLWTSRLLYVDERGWVYQVLPRREYVKVNVWR